MQNTTTKAPRVKTEAAKAAQMVRKHLKEAYPGIKFRVKSSTYSMGSSLDVSYVDGPKGREVESYVDQFQYGHFDGMNDIYEISNRKDFPQVKYSFTKREYSSEIQGQALKAMRELFQLEESAEWYDRIPDTPWNICHKALNMLEHMDLTKGFDPEVFKGHINSY